MTSRWNLDENLDEIQHKMISSELDPDEMISSGLDPRWNLDEIIWISSGLDLDEIIWISSGY